MVEIDDVITAMEDLVARHREAGDPSGYFAAMYLGVTREVERGLAEGRFARPAELEQLTVVFASRYLDASSSAAPTESWAASFDAASDRGVTAVQHLLLGMNAHINLDLGIACAEVAPGDAIDSIRVDFDEINEVLASLVGRVQDALSEISWLYRFVDDIAVTGDDAVINFSISRARSEAWDLALALAHMDPVTFGSAIERQDRAVVVLAEVIRTPPWWTRSALRVLRFTERTSVPDVIDLFARVGVPAL